MYQKVLICHMIEQCFKSKYSPLFLMYLAFQVRYSFLKIKYLQKDSKDNFHLGYLKFPNEIKELQNLNSDKVQESSHGSIIWYNYMDFYETAQYFIFNALSL